MLSNELRVQDPGDETTSYLLESVAEAAEPSKEAVGVFAFASQNGVDLLLGEPSISKLLKRGVFTLIVGIDAITNRKTLEHLASHAAHRHNLKVRVFWNEDKSALFHPKMCLFRGSKRYTAIVGSGNLTPGGLRDNFEAFSVTSGSPAEMKAVARGLDDFLVRQKDSICEIDDKVLERAAKNKSQGRGKAKDVEPDDGKGKTTEETSQPKGTRVLLAELPKGGDRWQQANFDKATIASYFKADSGSSKKRLVFLNEVNSDGTLNPDEVRPCVLTKSRNLRIQLGAHSGEDYPKGGRPVAVFRELKARHFAYTLLVPGETGYPEVQKILSKEPPVHVRRMTITLSSLLSAWKKCPLGRLRYEE